MGVSKSRSFRSRWVCLRQGGCVSIKVGVSKSRVVRSKWVCLSKGGCFEIQVGMSKKWCSSPCLECIVLKLLLKVVNSATGPGLDLARALWHSADSTNQVTLLWHEPSMLGWQHQTAYRWHLRWRPTRGIIR